MTNLPAHVRTVALIANGAIGDVAIADAVRRYDYVVAVDGGLRHCHAMQVEPDLLVGDLDSITDELLSLYPHVPVHRLPRLKNETDLEVALTLVDASQVTELAIFCGLQDRTDHCLANLHLLRRYPGRLQIISEVERIFCVKGDVEITTIPGQILSFLPLGGPVRGVTSVGLQWEFVDAAFEANFFSMSNVAIDSVVRISIPEGDLICILQKR